MSSGCWCFVPWAGLGFCAVSEGLRPWLWPGWGCCGPGSDPGLPVLAVPEQPALHSGCSFPDTEHSLLQTELRAGLERIICAQSKEQPC